MKTIKNRGFSLIELMVTIAIIGILASVAIPTYSGYVNRARVSNMLTYIQQGQVIVADYIASTGDRYCDNLASPTTPSTLDAFSYGDGWCGVEADGLISEFGFYPYIWYQPTMNDSPTGITITWQCWYYSYDPNLDSSSPQMAGIVPKDCLPD